MFGPYNKLRMKKTFLGVLAFTSILILWAYSTPIASGPDDDFHVQSAFCAHGNQENLCVKSETSNFFLVPTQIQYAYECQVRTGPGCLSPELRPTGMNPTNRVNAGMNFYPDLFYFSQGFMVGKNLDSSIFKMRLLSIGVVVTLLSASYVAVSKRLKRALIGTLTFAVTPVCMWILASNNPSSWAIVGSLTFFINLLNLFDKDSDNEILSIVVLLISSVVAVSSRSDAAVGLLIVTVVWIVSQLKSGSIKNTQSRVKLIVGIDVVYMATSIVAARQSEMLIDGVDQERKVNYIRDLIQNITSLPDLILGNMSLSISSLSEGSWEFLGGVSRLNVGIPSIVGIFYVFVLVLALNGGLRTMDNANKIFIQTICLVIASGALWLLQINHSRVGNLVQPRYLLPLVLIGVAAVLSCWPIDFMPIRPKMKIMFVVLASLANTVGINAVVNSYLFSSQSDDALAVDIIWNGLIAPSASQITFLTLTFSVIWYSFCYTELLPKEIGSTEMRCTTSSDTSKIVTVG
jgi:hypothetical protein